MDIRNNHIFVLFVALFSIGCSSESDPTNTISSNDNSQLIEYSINGDVNQNSRTRGLLVGSYYEMKEWGKTNGIAIVSLMPTQSNQVYFSDKLCYVGSTDVDGEGVDLGVWTTATKQYWPPQSLTFYAFLPYADSQRNISNDLTTISYTSPASNSGQADMMYALTQNVASGQVVPLNFRHALAAITFSARTVDNSVSVTIQGVDVCKVKTTGVFTLPTKSTLTNAEMASVADGADRIGTWTEVGSTLGTLSAGINETELTVDETDITASDGAITLIPQTLQPWDKTSEATTQNKSFLVIHCKLISAGLYFAGTASSFGEVYVPFEGTFEEGKHYNFSLTFGLGYTSLGTENKINVTIDTTITDWSHETLYFDEKIL